MGQGDGELEAFPAGGDRFFFGPDRLMWIRFVRAVDGAHVIEVHRPDSSTPQRAVRTGAPPSQFTVAPAVLRSYQGLYKTEALPMTVAPGADGRLTMTPAGQPSLPMRPVSETEFLIDGTPMRVVFHAENGKVDRVTIHRGARALNGQRVSH
jgi:hypothetical protein